MADKNTNLVWMDLEMTGLDSEIHKIVEASVLITDKDLNIISEGFDIIINVSESDLSLMNDFVRSMHVESGLLTKISKSINTLTQAENQILDLVKNYSSEKMSPLCGNSIYVDRKFIFKYMPNLDQYLLHRNIDVSTIKELYKRWIPNYQEFQKSKTHRALDDIKESIAELKYYRDVFFRITS